MNRIAALFALLSCWPLPALAQPPAPAEPFRITDNSFLVEEAFNQDAGIFQNIFGLIRLDGNWVAAFTQEWPLVSQAHQLSYTVAWLDSGHRGAGDVLLHYRYQALVEGPGRPAFSPRASLVLPTGDWRRGLGNGSAGLQVNLPFSKQTGDLYWHWNAGLTWLPRARAIDATGTTRRENLASPFVAGSAIYRAAPMVHLMLESSLSFDESIGEPSTTRQHGFTLSPGIRAGKDIGEQQLVFGLALPTTWSSGDRTSGVFGYFSYELGFRR
jgi:hypothetical protein